MNKILNSRGEVEWFWLVLMLPAVIYAIGAIVPKLTGIPDFNESSRACARSCEPRKVQEFTITDKTIRCVCTAQ